MDFKKVFNVEPDINVVYTGMVINGNITVSKTEDGGSNPSTCANDLVTQGFRVSSLQGEGRRFESYREYKLVNSVFIEALRNLMLSVINS